MVAKFLDLNNFSWQRRPFALSNVMRRRVIQTFQLFRFFLPYLQDHGLLRSRNFVTMATWRNDVFSLFKALQKEIALETLLVMLDNWERGNKGTVWILEIAPHSPLDLAIAPIWGKKILIEPTTALISFPPQEEKFLNIENDLINVHLQLNASYLINSSPRLLKYF